MGVITSNGVVGRIKTCSAHFSTVVSVLHLDLLVSAQLLRNHQVGSIRWGGENTRQVILREVPRDVEVQAGDTVLTSQYNTVYPPGILIGKVKQFSSRPDETFHQIEVSLSTDFHSLTHVYVVDNKMRQEQETLERNIQ
jgi:rod shape-determining protein MreC